MDAFRRPARLALVAVAAVLAGGADQPAARGAPPCTITFTGASLINPTSWQIGDNWDRSGAVPGTSDVACIPATKTVTLATGTATIQAVYADGPLTLTGGTLTLTDTADASTVKSLTMTGGTIGGEAVLAVSGTLTWSSGTMTGAGTTTLVAPNGKVVLSGTVTLQRTLAVASGTSLTLNAGTLIVGAFGALNNAGTIDSRAADCICISATGGPLTNTGTLTKSSGTGTTTIQTELDNTGGTVSVQTGFLALQGTVKNSASSKVGVSIAGTTPGSGYGQLQVTGAMPIAGTLVVTTDPAFMPSAAAGQTFTVMTYGSRSGRKFDGFTGQLLPMPSELGYAPAIGASSVALTLREAAELSLNGTAPATAPHGSTITYTETVTNNGRAVATGVKLTDTLPAGVSNVSASASQGTCTITTKVACALGTIANGASATVTIHVTAPANVGTLLTNKASVQGKQLDISTKNNAAKQKTTTT